MRHWAFHDKMLQLRIPDMQWNVIMPVRRRSRMCVFKFEVFRRVEVFGLSIWWTVCDNAALKYAENTVVDPVHSLEVHHC